MKMCVWGTGAFKITQTQLISLTQLARMKNCTQLCTKEILDFYEKKNLNCFEAKAVVDLVVDS